MTTKKICVIVAKEFLAAALGAFHVPPPNYFSACETKNIFETVIPRLTGGEPYPAKYLFGGRQAAGKSRGLLESYLDYGYDVEIRSATDASEALLDDSCDADIFDLLFSSASVESALSALSRGKNVSGWTPSELASKSFQMLAVALLSGGSPCLPRSLIIPSGARPKTAEFENLRGYFDSEYIIVKSAYGAASRLAPNLEYAITPARLFGPWILELADAAESESKQDAIVSELIITDDAYAASAENVVHKVNCCAISGASGRFVLAPADTCCKKVVCRMDFTRVSDIRPTRFGDVVTDSFWLDGNIAGLPGIENIVGAFDGFAACGCACTFDLMIPSDGKPRFLELNKLSATLADVTAISGDSALNIYARTVLRGDSPDKKFKRIEGYAKLTKKIKDEFYSAPGLILISPEDDARLIKL